MLILLIHLDQSPVYHYTISPSFSFYFKTFFQQILLGWVLQKLCCSLYLCLCFTIPIFSWTSCDQPTILSEYHTLPLPPQPHIKKPLLHYWNTVVCTSKTLQQLSYHKSLLLTNSRSWTENTHQETGKVFVFSFISWFICHFWSSFIHSVWFFIINGQVFLNIWRLNSWKNWFLCSWLVLAFVFSKISYKDSKELIFMQLVVLFSVWGVIKDVKNIFH